jgi:murein DD-endopeptidase MepM/ murein hydrolase activator NlpD
MRYKLNAFLLIGIIFIGASILYFSFTAFNSTPTDKTPQVSESEVIPEDIESPIRFGLKVNSFDIEDHIINKNEFLSTILGRYNIDPVTISTIVEKSKPIFDVRKMSAGKPYFAFTNKENPTELAYFIYQPNAIDYVVYDLRDSVHVYAGKKEVTTQVETIMGTINSSLYLALQENGNDPDIAIPLANVFGGVVDFYSIQEGDWFRIKYERQYVNDAPVGQGKIQSAVFSHRGKEFQAFYFQADSSSEGGYYDETGNSLRRTFLKAPLKYSRISSRFSGRRLHPVQKVWKAHLGTDYAAPHGTPIIATADGVVTESQFSGGNGNYVKIKHNRTYSTQYLHMSKRAVKKGQRVRQGQVIGYVGSTGLATGPHVCYRFWENGRQVDALRKNFRASVPIDDRHKAAFEEVVKVKQTELANISLKSNIEEKEYTAYLDGPPDLLKYFGKI